MREFESELQKMHPEFRRIWVQYSHHRQSDYHVVITLFPFGYGDYDMCFGHLEDFTFEGLEKLLSDYLQSKK